MQFVAFTVAGFIGMGVAVVHGILVQRLMIKPLERSSLMDAGADASIRKLIPALLQFSTFNWFVGGAVLVAAAFWFEQDTKLVTGLMVASSYLYGAIVNFEATRGRHPGWMLFAVAIMLICVAVIAGNDDAADVLG